MPVTIKEFLQAFKNSEQADPNKGAYESLLIKVKDACAHLQDAIDRAGEAVGGAFQGDLDKWRAKIGKIEASASQDHAQAMHALDASGIVKAAPAKMEAVLEAGRVLYQEKRARAEKAVLRLRARISNLSKAGQGQFKDLPAQFIEQFKAAEGLRTSDLAAALVRFDLIAADVQKAMIAVQKDEAIEEFHQLAPDAQQQAYQQALADAQGDIAECRRDPFKAQQVGAMLAGADAAARRENYKSAFTIIQGIKDIAADPDYAKKAKKLANMVMADKETQQKWRDDHKKWAEKADLSEYEGVALLGKGTFGAVISIHNKKNADQPTLVMKTASEREGAQDMLEEEAETYKAIGPHPNIVRCMGMRSFQDSQVLVMEELKGGSMEKALLKMKALRDKKLMTEEEYWGVLQFSLKKSLEALAFMEQKGFVHRDIKPQNIAYDSVTGEPKVIDLGLASEASEEINRGHTQGFVPRDFDDRTRDAYAIGASAFEVADGNIHGDQSSLMNPRPKGAEIETLLDDVSDLAKGPDDQPETETYSRIKREAVLGDDGQPVIEHDEAKTRLVREDVTRQTGRRVKREGKYGAETDYVRFMQWLMHKDQSRRPSPTEALNHPFLQDAMLSDDAARESIVKMLARDPDKEDRDRAQAREERLREPLEPEPPRPPRLEEPGELGEMAPVPEPPVRTRRRS